MEYLFSCGGLWACPPGVVLRLLLCVVQNNGVTGPEVNIGVLGIMDIPYLSTCRPVNLSTRLDMSRGKYIISSHYG